MDYPFTIKDISSRVKKTEQSLYSLIKKNQAFIKQNSHKQGRFIKYNQDAMNWFINYYGAAQDEERHETPPETALNGPQQAAEAKIEDLSIQLLQTKIEALQTENAALRERLTASEEERKELHSQLGMALSALQQEKQEKMLLLPPPRKTIAEKIKEIFQRPQAKNNNPL